jgi:Fungal specific transcription factor domain
LELLHQFCTVTYQTMTPDPSQQDVWKSTVIRLALSFPFLMHEILAIAALHLAHCKPERQSHYCTKATELQTHALGEFNDVQKNVGASNCSAIMIFSSLLALHLLADPSRRQGSNYSELLEHFIGCINLMRGVRSVVISDWWAVLSESELRPLFHPPRPEQPYDVPDECCRLVELAQNTDPGASSTKAYAAAVERLHWTFAASALQMREREHSTIGHVLAWPAQLKDDYLELLNERRPEALIILAYYGVLLHFRRKSWAIDDSGASLIRAINAHTGPFWGRWMAWPLQVIEGTGNVERGQT